MTSLADSTALLIGAGGLGCPALLGLVQSGVGRVIVADDDEVDESNLHRQILFGDDQIGQSKLGALGATLSRLGLPAERVERFEHRFLPDNALSLTQSVQVVIEGADNYATKFLAADTAQLANVPVIHGAALGWQATVWAVAPGGRPCYRCLFEDLPAGDDLPNCSSAGVMGPVVGLAGALMAELALRVLGGELPYGSLFTYDGRGDRLRSVPLQRRVECPLCGKQPTISDIDEARYLGARCGAA